MYTCIDAADAVARYSNKAHGKIFNPFLPRVLSFVWTYDTFENDLRLLNLKFMNHLKGSN